LIANPDDQFWPAIAYAFPGISAGDAWAGVNPLAVEAGNLLTVSATENADKNGIVWPANTSGGGINRQFRGTFDATNGNVTLGVSASTVVGGGTLTYADGDWMMIGETGAFNFDGSGGGATKTRGEWWLRSGGVFAAVATCPHFDVPITAGVWSVSDAVVDNLYAANPAIKGHALHFGGWWHKGGAYWVLHSAWNLENEAKIKTFIATLLHRECQALKAHYEALGRPLVIIDGINEPFDEDITATSAVKEPGLRGWNRTFPVYTNEESCWHRMATFCTSIGANNIVRIEALIQYTLQTFFKYFPGHRVGPNDFGWEGRRYTTNTLQVSTPDVNGNTANKTVWLGHQQGQKQIAVEYYLWKLCTAAQTPLVFDATLDAGAVWVPPKAMGCQFHDEPKNQHDLTAIAYILNRMTYMGIEPYLSEINHRGEHLITNQVAGIVTITGGSGSITSVKACFPTLQTVTGDELLSGAVAFNTSTTQTAIDLAANINGGTGTHLYTAVASSNTVRLRRDSAPRGFDVTTAGTLANTPSNSRVNEPTNCPPQFRAHYVTSLLASQNTQWKFGWSVSNEKFWRYGTWVVESFIGTYLRQSLGRLIKWWTPTGGSGGNPISLWTYSYVPSTSYEAMRRLMASSDWKTPGGRTVKNRGRLNFMWYKHLVLTQSGVTVDVNGLGTVINGAAGTNTHPWAWWKAQGIQPTNFAAVLSWDAPADPAANVVLFTSYTDANNRIDLYFSDAAGTLKCRSIVAGVTKYDFTVGDVTASSRNVVVLKVQPGGARTSLNGAAVASALGQSSGAATISVGFDHAGANGYNGNKYLVLDMWEGSEVPTDAAVVAACVAPVTVNPWPLWDGTAGEPTLMTE
jgi:hypothetical protein